MTLPAFRDARPELPNGTRLGGRYDDFAGIFGPPCRELAQPRGTACFFVAGPEQGGMLLAVLFEGDRAVHLALHPPLPFRSAIMSRLAMLQRWPEDGEVHGRLTLHHYESSMNRAQSTRLAHALPPHWFVDANDRPVAPGTFTCVATRRGWSLSAGGRVISITE